MFKKILFSTIIAFSFSTLIAQNPTKFIAIDNNGNTFEIDPSSCTSTPLNRCASSDPFSIALINNMVYYTEGFDLFRYQFNTSGSCQFLGTFNYSGSSFLSSLTSGPDGMIYAAAGNTILKYNPTTNVFSNLGNIPSQWQSSGDLVFFEGQLLLSTINDKLVRIDLNNLSNSQVILSFASNTNIFGLSTVTPPCGNNQLFAINSSGGNTTLLPINLTTNTVGAATCSFPFQIYDTASLAENGSSSNIIPTFTQVAPICSGAPLAALPTTSINSINGTWSPAINNTATTTYTFTPTTGQCATTTTMTITVDNPSILHITKDDPNCDPNQLSWGSLNTISATVATTTLGTNAITINKPTGGLFSTSNVFNGSIFPTQFNLPINSPSLANFEAGLFTFCFDTPVVNPQIAIASIGQSGLPVPINTSAPYQVIWAGPGMTFTNNQSLIGVEGYCIIVFPGTHQCISFDYLNAESYCNIVFGSQDSNCQIDPICIGESVTLAAHGSTNITWSPTTNLTFLPNNKVIAAPTQTTTYTITSNDACQSQASITVTVLPNNTITPTSTNTTLCIGTTLTNITHSTTGATGIGATTTNYGLPTGVSASWNANIITISGTPTVSGTFNYTIPLIGGCGSVSATGTINVTSNNTVGPASSSPTLCVGTALTNITHATTGANGIAATTTNHGLPTGVSASWNANTITISGTPTASGTFNYTIPLTGGCGSVSATGTINVTSNNTVGPASSSPTLCVGTALTNITHATTGANGIAATTTNHGLPTGVSASWNANTITISGTPTASGTFNYTIPLTGGCGSVSATGTITVTANNTVGPASSSPTLCVGTALTNITHTTTGANGIGATTTNYGLPTGVSASWNANTITISGTPTASGTFNYTIPLTGGCGSVSATGTITVTSNNTVGPASSSPTLCVGTALTNITHSTTGATGIATTTTNYGLPTGVSASWNANTITISGTPTASGTFNYTIPLTVACGSVSATGTINVTSNNTVGPASSSPTLCVGTALTNFTHSTTGATGIATTTTNYGLPTGVSASWNANTITISGTPTASGTFNYTIPLTGGCGSVSATGTINVTSNNTVGPASSSPTLCVGTALTNIIHSTTGATGIATSTTNYGLPTGVSASWNANTITISGTPTASGTFNYTIPLSVACGSINATGTITVVNGILPIFAQVTPVCQGATINIPTSSTNTPPIVGVWNLISSTVNDVTYEFTPNPGQCALTTPATTMTIVVHPLPIVTPSVTTQSFCSGGTTNINLLSDVPGSEFYWTATGTSVTGQSGSVIGSGATSINQTLTLNTGQVAAGQVTYTIVAEANGCLGAPVTVVVTVNPIPNVIVSPVSLTETICSGGTTNISFTGAINNTVYTWSVVSSVGVSGALNGVGTSINQILTTTGLSQGTVVYEVTPSLNGCPGTPQRITVTVNPVPAIFGSTSHRDLCSGVEPTNITVFTFNAATVFNWVVEPNGVSGASSGTATGLSINIVQTLTTTGNVRGYVDYIITPVLTGCSGIPITVRVYVNPLPVVSLTDGTICVDAAGVPFQSYVLDSGLNDVDYDFVWTFEDGTIPVATIPGATSATYTATEVGTYTVVATNNTTNCVSNIASAVVTATNPATSLTVTQSEYFSDNATLVVTVTGGNGTLLYQLDQGILQESNVFTGVSAGTHDITVVDNQGCTYLTQEVLVIDYPKYFTPNGDGHNDTWNIIGLNQQDAKLYIFDRYGKLLKQLSATTASEGWNGIYNNEKLPSTDYWFTLDYTENGTQKQFKAHFSLKR